MAMNRTSRTPPLLVLAAMLPLSMAALTPALGAPAACEAEQLEVMVLGTYHMANPGLDAVNREADDVYSDRRQAEIRELVDRLARFKPDRVLVEAAYGDRRIHERYVAYLADDHELTRNETDQIGYRLARQLGHESVYPIDYPMFQDSTAYEFYVAHNPDAKEMGEAFSAGWGAEAKADDARLRSSSIAEYLVYLNGPDIWSFGLDSRYMLATSVQLAQYDQYAGADMLTSWYKRNLRMLTNLHRSVEEDDQRVLMLVGSGHNKILWELLDTSPILCRVDPRPWLEG